MGEKRDWRRAGRSLQRLIEDAERTEEVFEIFEALSGPADERFNTLFRSDPAGAHLLREKPGLLSRLSDREALAALPAGTLGHAYARFMSKGGLTAGGLVEADVTRPGRAEDSDPDDLYIGERQRDAHDLWHVVTGYGMDEAGETALLAFSFAQFGNLGMGLIAGAAALIGPRDWRLTWQRYLLRAWWRGKRARSFATVPWEEWLARPLAWVREDLRVDPPDTAHPGGILVADRGRVLKGGRVAAAGA